MATHSSTLAWQIPWTEEPVGYSPWGRKESDTTERLPFPLSLWSKTCFGRNGNSVFRSGFKLWLYVFEFELDN